MSIQTLLPAHDSSTLLRRVWNVDLAECFYAALQIAKPVTEPVVLVALLARGPGRPPLTDDPDVVLAASERRRLILRLVQETPGLPLTELRRVLDMGAGTLYHHLDRMTRAGLIEVHRAATHLRVYPAGTAPTGEKHLLDKGALRDVAEFIARAPGVSSAAIAAELGISQRMVRKHLRPLLDLDLVTTHVEGRRQTYHPTSKLRQLLQTH